MEEEKGKLYTIVILAAAATLLLSCVIGAFAGGVAGAIVGRRQARAAVERLNATGLRMLPRFREEMPHPWHRDQPWPPDVPPGERPPFEGMPPGMGGAIIVEVIPGSPAEQAGLAVGDLITAIDRTPIDARHPLSDVIGQYEPGDRITIHFWRAGKEETVRAVLAENPENRGTAYLGVYFEPVDAP